MRYYQYSDDTQLSLSLRSAGSCPCAVPGYGEGLDVGEPIETKYRQDRGDGGRQTL